MRVIRRLFEKLAALFIRRQRVAKPAPLSDAQVAAATFSTVMWCRRAPINDGGEPPQDQAQKLVNEMIVREALERSIRKYSPRLRGQA